MTIFGSSGEWANSKYPRLYPGQRPAFPLATGQSFTPGGTQTGFLPFSQWMSECGYFMSSQNTYLANNISQAVFDQYLVQSFQAFAGLEVTGNVDATTWDAAFAAGTNENNILNVYYQPLAELPQVEPYAYNPGGAYTGINPSFVPTIPRIERYEQMGQQITKAQGIVSAQVELERTQIPSWNGTITLTIDPPEQSRFTIQAGQNILLRYFHGQDTVFHISAVSVDWVNQSVQLTVSSQPTDLNTLAAVWNRDTQTHGVSRQARPSLATLNISNNTTVYDAESGAGIIPPTVLPSQTWTVLRIPFSEAGSIAEVNLTTAFPITPFCTAVFSGPVTGADIVNAGMGAPLTEDSSGNNPWNTNAVALDALGLLYGAGGPDGSGGTTKACGYWPSDPNGTATLTGRYVDGQTWPFASAPGYTPWLWVAFWANNACAIAGQFMQAPPTYNN